MTSNRRRCKNYADTFCYICGEYTFKENIRPISECVKKSYLDYFGVNLGDQDKSWAPHIVCNTCCVNLRQWTQGKRNRLKFGVPMVWREPRNHLDDCYFCLVSIAGINRKNRNKWQYPDLPSARRPIPHSEDVPIPKLIDSSELSSEFEYNTANDLSDCDSVFEDTETIPQRFNQCELNNLIRDLALSKEASEVLASRLNDKKLLERGTKITYYRTRDKAFLTFFTKEDNLVFCNNVNGLMQEMGLSKYLPSDWRLFVDSSKRSLKCVLLHNGNVYASIPIAHSTTMKEEYNNIALVMKKIKYQDHQWIICVDLKMVNFLLGQQSGYTKYPCFLCLWDSRSKQQHWRQKYWPTREKMIVGDKNIANEALVPREKIVLPPLHIKLGLMKQFVKALNRDGECFAYICSKMPNLSRDKIRAGVFDGPQIRQFMNDNDFDKSMTETERNAWASFVQVIKNFLGNNKAPNYVQLVENMLDKFRDLGCNMSIKIHYLHTHLDRFPENLGNLSEEQGERFHQDIKIMENRYQGRWDTHMMADYCWNLQRDSNPAVHSRMSHKRSFTSCN